MANRRFIDFPVATTVGANDIILIWQDGLNKQTTKATILSGLPEDLEDLADVNISGLTNGQILRYDSTTGKWENTDQGNLDLNDLNDVSIVSPSNGQVLVYNSSTSKWENSSAGFVPYVGAVTTVNLGAQTIQAGSFVKQGGTSAQFLKADGSVDSTAYGTGSVTSVGLTMPSAFNVGSSPITTNGTLAVTGAGTTAQYVRGDGSLATFPGLTGFVPYTGATADVNLGTHDLTAERGTFENNGSSDTLTVNHTSGSGIGVKVTKGGNNEALLVTKTSGSGNAMAVVGGRTSLVDLSLSSVSNATGNFLTISGGVVHQRTASETRSDVGAQAQLNGTGFVKASGTTITYDNSTYQVTSEKAQPNGYASLDSNGKVPLVQINDALIGNVNFQGLWNAATNTPTLANPPASGTKGYYYIVSTAGSFAGIDFEVGDWIISNGTAWGKVDNTDAVSSVFGRTGNVTATNGDYNTSQVTENTNLYYTEARVNANTNVAANTAARHNAVTLGTANGLSLSTQVLSLQLATSGQNGALSSTDWSTFNNKENAITAGTTAQYYRGDKTFQTLNTGVVPESGNLYFTNARAIASVLTGYSSGAGTISAADSILSAIQKLNGNIGALVTGVSSVNGQTGVVVLTTTNIAEGTNLYYTEARVNANTNVAANTAARHAAVTLGTANGLSLSTQQLSLGLASAGVTGALSGTDWSTFNSKVSSQWVTSGSNIYYTTGSVLIGTVSSTGSARKLEVAGDVFIDDNTTTGNGVQLKNADRPLITRGFDAFTSGNKTGVGRWGLYMEPGEIFLGAPGTDYTNGRVTLGGWLLDGTKQDNLVVRNDTRRVGIGTGTPGTTLDVIGSVTATSFIRSGGTSSQFLKADGSVDSNTYYLASNPSAFIALTALSGTAPIQYNNTTGAISITQASGSTNGFLSSTDWNTFNNKTSNVGTVTSVAALTLGTAGTDLSSSVANGTTTPVITLNVPTASAANRGALSAADWTTFNGKENAITAGTTAQYYRGDKTFQTLNTAAVPELTNLYYTEARVNANANVAANTAARHNAVTLGTANGLSLSTQELSLGLASSSANGALSSTDWTTFNNKQNALTNPVTGTGTTNYLPKFTGASTIGNSLVFDNGTNVGINTTTPYDKLEVNGAIAATGASNENDAQGHSTILQVKSGISHLTAVDYGVEYKPLLIEGKDISLRTGTSATGERVYISNAGNVGIGTASPRSIDSTWGILTINGSSSGSMVQLRRGDVNAGYLYSDIFGTALFETRASRLAFGTSDTERMIITAAGRVLIGTPPPAESTFTLDVNGTGRFSGSLRSTSGDVRSINTGSNSAGSGPFYLLGDTTGTNFFLNQLNASNGIDWYYYNGSYSSSLFKLTSTGAATFSSSVTASTGYFLKHSNGTTVAALEQFSGTQGAGLSLFNSSGTQNVLFNAGGDSFIRGGNVGIATSTPATILDVFANTDIWHTFIGGSTSKLLIGGQAGSGGVVLQAGNSSTPNNAVPTTTYRLMLQRDGGNVLIGTATDAGGDRRLQVAGNLFVDDNTTTGNGVQLKNADRPLITRGWDAFTSGNKTGVGRWGVYMESAELFIGSPGTDYTNGLVTIGGWLVDGTRQPNLTVNNQTRNVLIGTTTDNGHKLQLSTSSTSKTTFSINNTSANKTYEIGVQGSSGTLPNRFYIFDDDRNAFLFTITSGGTSRFHSALETIELTSESTTQLATISGNVLIGTTTDTTDKLRVNGNTYTNTIRTHTPDLETRSVAWKLGASRGGTVTTNATVRVEIDGVLVDLVARYV